MDDSTSLEFFDPNNFPKEVLNKPELYRDGVCQKIFRPEDGDDPEPSPQFVFILCTSSEAIPPELMQVMHPIKVVEARGGHQNAPGRGGSCDDLDAIAGLYGASEVIR